MTEKPLKEFDYIVVGGGSGGCAVAGRLSEKPNVSVCLIEAGGSGTNTLIRVPSGIAAVLPTPIDDSLRLCQSDPWQFGKL